MDKGEHKTIVQIVLRVNSVTITGEADIEEAVHIKENKIVTDTIKYEAVNDSSCSFSV